MHLRHRTASCAAVLAFSGALVAVAQAPASAASEYWVDATSAACSDAGTGTQTAPFCTIGAAAKKAVNAGDTVHVMPGTYREQVNVAGSGTAGSPITFLGSPGAVILGTQSLSDPAGWTATGTTAWSRPYAPSSTPRQVLLDGSPLTAAPSATTTTSGSYFYDTTAKVLYVDTGGGNPAQGHTIEAGAQSYGVNVASRSYVVVSGLTARNQNFAGVRVFSSSAVTVDQVTVSGSASNGVLVDTSQSATVSNATVSGSSSSGIRLTGSSGATVSGSTSHDNGLDGIQLTTSTGATLTGNTAYRNVSTNPAATGVGIDVNSGSANAVVTDNVSHDNQDSGFQAYNGANGALVARNISYGNGDHGFDTLSTTGVSYLNNTSYGNARDGISVEGNSTGATLANNLLVDNGVDHTEFDLYVDSLSMSGFSADYDVVYNHAVQAPVKVNGTIYPTLAAFVTATGLEQHGGQFAPGFVNPGNADFALTGGSAAVDAANSGVAGFVTQDAAGNTPADDSLVPDTGAGSPAYADRGALEFQPSGSPTDYAPHAAMFLDPPAVAVPPSATVTADARGSNDADTSGIVSYTFDFGDGTVVGPQSAATATHSYSATGTYSVTVTVTDASGMSDTASADETVTSRVTQTYYVAQGAGCSDTGPGTSDTPFCTIGAATKKALAGDTVLVGPGTYREQLTATASGQAGAPITVTGSGPSSVILGSTDVSDAAGWTATGTNAWKHSYTSATAPTEVWLDGSPLTQASSATTTTSGSWFYDGSAGQLYVDIGGANPANGHTVAVGARNFGMLLRNVSDYVVSGFSVAQTNLAGVYLDTTTRVSVSNVTVSLAGTYGVTVDGSAQASLDHITSFSNQSIGVRFSNDTDSSLSASSTHDNQLHGVSVQGGQNNTVSGVTSFRNLKPGSRVADGIDVSQGAVGTVVQRCTAYDNDDSGMEAFTGAQGTVFRRNLVYDNGDHGIDNSNGPGSTVVSNTVVGNATAGINVEGSSTGAFLRDNIAMDNAVGSTRTVGEIRVDATSTTGTTLDRDQAFKSASGVIVEWAGTNYNTLAAAATATGQEQHGIGSNPRFVDAAGRDLRLTGSSPAVDAAYTGFAAWVSADHDGGAPVDDPVVADTGNGPDAAADLGALEYTGPFAQATATPVTGYAPLDVSLDASGSTTTGAPITGYAWTCGNGTSATGLTATCHYSTAGTYTVSVEVTSADGSNDTWSTSVTVRADAAPVAALSATPSTQYVTFPVTLDASGSTDNDSYPIATYAFTCGNGTATHTGTDPTWSCTYGATGTFTATVKVTDTLGLASTATTKVTVIGDQAPKAVLSLSATKVRPGQSITADGSASTDTDPWPIATYRFDCGNNLQTTPDQASPTTTCTYKLTGNYTVRMWVTDTQGKVSSTTKKVQVK
ncbi:MAG TPA: right-handed parallel beta-helix repeat-containing protein [Nocardioides sp.]|uniref:right-handed parallel beta-helix repeat-containing protein n=1 Tax=Nocardioides sp. TaxID=35761 RepID=UPI002F4280B9